MADYLVHFNKNHDPKSGRFTFGDGNGDGVSPDDYRTPELDKTYSELEKTGVLELNKWKHNKPVIPHLNPEDDAEKVWGKDLVKAVDIGMKAYGVDNIPELKDKDINSRRTWFLSGGGIGSNSTVGFPDIAYLIVKGWPGEKVFNALRDAGKMYDKTTEFRDDYIAYPNEGWIERLIGIAEKYPYKNVYPLSRVSKLITDENDSVDTYIFECEELFKEMEHSDMEYPNYLAHFNPNHNPKTGRFDFSNDTPRKKYSGKKRSEFIKDMKSQYKSAGHSSYKSSRYAKTAADQNQWETYQYNKGVKKFKKTAEKMYDVLDKNGNNRNDVRVKKFMDKLAKEYATLNELEILLNNDYAVGEMFTRSYIDALSGVPKYNKNTNLKAKAVAYFS